MLHGQRTDESSGPMSSTRPLAASLVAAAILLCAAACVTDPSIDVVERDLAYGRNAEAVAKLEVLRDRHPQSSGVRLLLGDLYYQLARESLDAGDETAYTRYLGAAQHEVLTAVELRPADPRPHTWMGIIAAYQGHLDTSLESFRNARRLDPVNPVSYTNLAHIHVYEGQLRRARRMLAMGRRLRAPQDELDRIEILAAWRERDFVEARDLYDMARDVPGFADSWDGVPLPEPMRSFDDFAAVCCANPTCGPNMEGACRALALDVRTRDLEAQAILEELRLEMERKRRLREIYERRKDLEIVVEEPVLPAAPER